jgi:hypothetical protein
MGDIKRYTGKQFKSQNLYLLWFINFVKSRIYDYSVHDGVGISQSVSGLDYTLDERGSVTGRGKGFVL